MPERGLPEMSRSGERAEEEVIPNDRPPIEAPEPGDDRSNRFGYPEGPEGQPMYWDARES